jgi:hypothetical protein
MKTFWKTLMLAAAGIMTAFACAAIEQLPPLVQPSDDARAEVFSRQDRRHQRREAENARAQRSICEAGCRDSGLPRRTQPADPFTRLPSWDDPPVADQVSAE